MRPIHRHVHLDFHNLPGIYDFCREWDAAVFAQQLQDANVDFVNFWRSAIWALRIMPRKWAFPIRA